MIAKRGLIVLAILVSGALIGAVLMPALRAPTRTVVAPVELTTVGSSVNSRAADEREGSEEVPTSDGDTSEGADPVPPPSPVPAGDNSGPGNDDVDSGPGNDDDNSGPGSDSSGPGSGDDGDSSGSGS